MEEMEIIFKTMIVTIIIVAQILLFNWVKLLHKKLKELTDQLNRGKNLHPPMMGQIVANSPHELFKEIKRVTGLNVKAAAAEEIDEYGRNKAWYIKELTRMDAKFDSDSTLEELSDLYDLL